MEKKRERDRGSEQKFNQRTADGSLSIVHCEWYWLFNIKYWLVFQAECVYVYTSVLVSSLYLYKVLYIIIYRQYNIYILGKFIKYWEFKNFFCRVKSCSEEVRAPFCWFTSSIFCSHQRLLVGKKNIWRKMHNINIIQCMCFFLFNMNKCRKLFFISTAYRRTVGNNNNDYVHSMELQAFPFANMWIDDVLIYTCTSLNNILWINFVFHGRLHALRWEYEEITIPYFIPTIFYYCYHY